MRPYIIISTQSALVLMAGAPYWEQAHVVDKINLRVSTATAA